MKQGIGGYEIGRVIGHGKFGTVYLARNQVSQDPKAIKIINKETLRNPKMIRKEISTMKLIKHPHVVQLLEINVGKLSEDEARKYFQQLILAVDYCHSRGVYHRDLKLENLLLDTKGNLKVSDFGLSALSQQCSEDGLLHTTCGTPNYVAPEVIHGKGYNGTSADLWSCGIILYVMLVGCLPFDEPNTIALHRKACQANFMIPSWLSDGAQNLIKRILDPNPKTRISVPEILSNEWFKIGYLPVRGFEKDLEIDDIDPIFDQGEDMEKIRPPLVNAFDIISMSPGLNLSGLFRGKKDLMKKETQFTTKEPAKTIVSKIEGLAKSLGFNVKEKDYRVRLQSAYPGRKGRLSISSEILEVSPSLSMVNMKKTSGDTLEYYDFHKKLTITLKDIVWKSEDGTA